MGDVPEMVKRVARGIYEAPPDHGLAVTAEMPVPWERVREPHKRVLYSRARAAIAAMREPTEAMIDVDELDYSNLWRAMIDKALGL